MKIFSIAVIICNIFIINSNALCNFCGSTGVACISENQFRTCSGGTLTVILLLECIKFNVCNKFKFVYLYVSRAYGRYIFT